MKDIVGLIFVVIGIIFACITLISYPLLGLAIGAVFFIGLGNIFLEEEGEPRKMVDGDLW